MVYDFDMTQHDVLAGEILPMPSLALVDVQGTMLDPLIYKGFFTPYTPKPPQELA